MSKMFWTQEMRKKLYTVLATEKPSTQEDLDTILGKIARELSKDAGRPIKVSACRAQMAWATNHQLKIKHKHHLRNYLFNRAAALEAGFITLKDLPETVLLHY